MILIRGGQILGGQGLVDGDVLVEGTVIVAVGPDLGSGADRVIEAGGCLVGPGFVDLHVHLREPGEAWKEDIESGSRAAAAGGFTAVVAMPNTDPPIDDPKVVGKVIRRGAEVGLVDVACAAALTMGRAGMAPSDVESLYRAGVRVFSDDGDSVEDAGVLRDVMRRVARLEGALVAQHAEDTSLSADGHMHEGPVSNRLEVGGMPADAEMSIVARDLDLVTETGVAYHCQHISGAGTVDLIRQAKVRGLPVTAEVTPHHLSFDDNAVNGRDTGFKMYPPLRSRKDRDSVRAALLDGTIDVVASDHAPHSPDEKSVAFDEAPRGVIGLETAAAVVNGVVSDPVLLFRVLSTNPAHIGGFDRHGRAVMPGEPANLVVFDPQSEWVPGEFASKSSNSPYIGRTLRGRVAATIHEGDLSYRHGGAE